MITAQQLFDNIMDLMDKRNNTGEIDAAKTARYKVRAPSIITIGQNVLARDGDLYNSYEIYHSRFRNLLGIGFDEPTTFTGEEVSYISSETAYAYYFDVDGDGIINVEEETSGAWNLVTSIVASGIIGMTAYKGILIPTVGVTRTRITFTGTNFYRFMNVAFFAEPFTIQQVPVYRAWVEYIMPDDFKSVQQIIKKSPIQSYQRDSYYTWEGKNRLYIDYNYTGIVKVIYVPICVPILDLTQVIEIDDTASINCLTYFVAAHLLLMEDPEISAFYNQMYMEAKAIMRIKPPAAIDNIEDVYLYDGGIDLWQL